MAINKDNTSQANDLLASSKEDVEAVIREKDKYVGGNVHADRREYDRLQYQVPKGLVLTIIHPGGSDMAYRVYPYNLSEGGIGVVHGAFAYPSSRCIVGIRLPDGSTTSVEGTVVRCSHLRGRVHDLGIKFDEPVKHGWYEESVDEAEPEINESSLSCDGNALVLSSSRAQRDLLRFMLAKLGVGVTCCSSASDAVEAIKRERIDMVVFSVWKRHQAAGLQFVESLRAEQFPCAIIAVADDLEMREILVDAGCSDVVFSLTDTETLNSIAAKYLVCTYNQDDDDEPLLSSRWDDTAIRPLILKFIEQLQPQIANIRSLLNQSDTPTAEELIRELCVTSADYGFDSISAECRDLQQMLDSTEAGKDFHATLNKLASLCSRAGKAKSTQR